MNQILELREKRAKVWEEAKAFLDSKRGKDGLISPEDAAIYEKMEEEVVNLGKEVEIRTYRMVDKKKEFTGLLDSYDYEAGTVTIELEDGTMKTFEKGDIALIRLAFDF